MVKNTVPLIRLTVANLFFTFVKELSGCGLEVIEAQAFSGLGNLRWLKLDKNKIKNLPSNTFLPLQGR